MINTRTDNRADVYFISVHIWEGDTKRHFMNRTFNQKGMITTRCERGVD